ncbi:hypothetical protein BC332_25565 [Capsicum chinense]|nr:hypothetical protein BC332_25565 [Capsicum chinense]
MGFQFSIVIMPTYLVDLEFQTASFESSICLLKRMHWQLTTEPLLFGSRMWPLSCGEEDTLGGYALMLIDSLDMLVLLSDRERFTTSVKWISKNLRFDIGPSLDPGSKLSSTHGVELLGA